MGGAPPLAPGQDPSTPIAPSRRAQAAERAADRGDPAAVAQTRKRLRHHAAVRIEMLVVVLVASTVIAPLLAHWAPNHAFVVASDSMKGAIPKGSLAYSASVPAASVSVGDVVVYTSPTGPREVHRVVAIDEHGGAGGSRLFTTRGDANPSPDSYAVREQDLLGRVRFSLPLVGYLWLMPVALQVTLFAAFTGTYLLTTAWEARAWLWHQRASHAAGGFLIILPLLLVQAVMAAVSGTPPASTQTIAVATTPLPLTAGTWGSASITDGTASVTLTAPKLWKETQLYGCSPGTSFPPTCSFTPLTSTYGTTSLSMPPNILLVDTSLIDGTVEYYFEATMVTESTRTLSVRLLDVTSSTAVTGSEITTTSTTTTTVRSSSFTLSGSDEYSFQAKVTGGVASSITSVKLLSAQQYPTKTTTSIPISQAGQTPAASTAFAIPVGATKWLYSSSGFDGAVNVYFEAVGDATATTTTSFTLNDRTAATTTSTITTTSVTPARVRSTALTLTDAHEYEVEIKTSSALGTGHLYMARVVVTQATFTTTQRYEDVSGPQSTTSTSFTTVGAGGKHNPSTEWGALSATWEATLRDTTAGQTATVQLYDTTAGAAIASSSLATTGTTNTRQRATVTLTNTDPTTYNAQLKASANTAELRGAWLIVTQADGKQYDHVVKATNNTAGSCTWTFTGTSTTQTGVNKLSAAKISIRGDGSLVDQVIVASGSVTQSSGSSVSVAYGAGHTVQVVVSSRPSASGSIILGMDLKGTCSGIHTTQPLSFTLQ